MDHRCHVLFRFQFSVRFITAKCSSQRMWLNVFIHQWISTCSPSAVCDKSFFWWIAQEFRPTSATPGQGNSSNTFLLLHTCSFQIALIRNGYHTRDLQRGETKKKKKEKKNGFGEGALGFHNRTLRLRKEQKLFIGNHVASSCQSSAFGCYQNPCLSLFNLYCGFCLSRLSLAAIDFAGSCAPPSSSQLWKDQKSWTEGES